MRHDRPRNALHLECIALRSGAEHVGGVHRVEIFLDRLNLAVTHHEEKVIEVLVGLSVFHLGLRFGIASHHVAESASAPNAAAPLPALIFSMKPSTIFLFSSTPMMFTSRCEFVGAT